MSSEPQLFKINPTTGESVPIREVNFTDLGFQERQDIQEWIASNPGILGQDLLIVSKEFSGFDRTNERLDLLAVDIDGRLVVIELKRDDTGVDVHWQAIKYASYLHRVRVDDIVKMFANYAGVSIVDARNKLIEHLGSDDDLNALNNDQRIILASHRFAPEVTSAALWLNEKTSTEDLITCVQLTPYHDPESGALYILANTIIPVPGVERYVIGVGEASATTRSGYNQNRDDAISRFLKGVSDLVLADLPDALKPDRRSRWAGGDADWRYYRMWYARSPWGHREANYYIELSPQVDTVGTGGWRADIGFGYRSHEDLEAGLADVRVFDDQRHEKPWIWVSCDVETMDEETAVTLASKLTRFIEAITPRVEASERDDNEEDT